MYFFIYNMPMHVDVDGLASKCIALFSLIASEKNHLLEMLFLLVWLGTSAMLYGYLVGH